jgi:hypothetical protein
VTASGRNITNHENEIRFSSLRQIQGPVHELGPIGEFIIEALVRGHQDPKTGVRMFDSLSMRFAVCQHEGAAWQFLKLVKRLCDSHSLVVVQGEKTYSPEVFWAFRLRANEQIRSQQVMWREIFEGDGERTAVGVEVSWGHFLRKHPNLLEVGEPAMAPHKVEKQASVEIDVEQTLPRKAGKSIPVPRQTP